MTSTRKRPISAVANDELIRQTATSVLANDGLGGLTLSSIAKQAGLSHTAMSMRFVNRDALLCDVWVNHSCKLLDEMLAWCRAFLNHEATPSLKELIKPSDQSSCFVELLTVAATNLQLRTVVQKSFLERLNEATKRDVILTTQVVFLLELLIGVCMELRVSNVSSKRTLTVVNKYCEAIRSPAEIETLPDFDVSHMYYRPFGTGDELRDKILESCLQNVGQHGFENTTTKAIAAGAEVSEGLLFSMFSSKIDIFFEATTIQSRLGFTANLEYMIEMNQKYEPGIANAVLIAGWQSPQLADQRAALLEQIRLTWHNLPLRRMIDKTKRELLATQNLPELNKNLTDDEKAARFIELAIPTGVYVMAVAFPPAAQLPYSVVTKKLP